MLASLSRHQALRILIARAVVLLALVRLIVSASRIDSPPGVVLVVAVLGWVDLRRRHESILWANLGYSMWHTASVFAAVALIGESLMAILIRPLVNAAMQHPR